MLIAFKSLKIKTRIILANSMAILLLLLFAGIVYFNTKVNSETSGWVLHTQEVISIAHKLTEELLNMETGQRGFLITGAPEFLEPYQKGKENIFKDLGKAKELVSDNPGQVRVLEKVETLANRWIMVAGEAEIEARKMATIDEVEKHIQKKRGKKIMDELRGLLAGFIAVEEGLMEERERRKSSSVKRTALMIFAGTLISILIVLISLWLVAESIAYPIKDLEKTVHRIGEGDLTVRSHIKGSNEISSLSDGISSMAEKLEKNQEELTEAREEARTAAENMVAAYDELKAEKEFTDKAVNAQRDTFFLFEVASGKALRWNNAFRDVSGYSDEEIAAMKAPDDWYDADDLAKAANATRKIIEEGTGTLELSLVTKDGRRIPTEYKASVIYGANGEPEQIISTGRDITERKKTERSLKNARKEAEAASEAKSQFLANMSHEIRTPMTSIFAMAELLSETEMTEEQAEYVDHLSRAGDSLLSIINDILDLSKVEAGLIELEEINFSIYEEIEKIVSIFGVKAKKKGLTIKRKISSHAPGYVFGDPVRLRQVLVNLVGNAIKFTQCGEVEISIRCEEQSDCGERCRLIFSVSDTGIGIAGHKLAKIFEAFSQADTSTTRIYGGTGLGLSISKKLVSLMGGNLQVESEEGKGSRFSFTLDMKVGAEEEGAGEEHPALSEAGKERALNILLVEDAEDNRLLVNNFLKGTHHRLDMAINGEEAVEMFTAGEYDLVLMDIQMPVMDGFEATRIIRGWEERNDRKAIPIVAFTAHALKEDVDKCIEAGCTEHLAKPIKKKRLLDVIHSYS